MSIQNTKVWFITGSSTGFGRILAEQLLEKGETVIATARKPEKLDDLVAKYQERVLAVRLDVKKPEEVREAIGKAITAFGRIKEVAPLGIKITMVEPGAFRTDFNGRSPPLNS